MLGPQQAQTFLVLHGAQRRHVLEMLVKHGPAHVGRDAQRLDIDRSFELRLDVERGLTDSMRDAIGSQIAPDRRSRGSSQDVEEKLRDAYFTGNFGDWDLKSAKAGSLEIGGLRSRWRRVLHRRTFMA